MEIPNSQPATNRKVIVFFLVLLVAFVASGLGYYFWPKTVVDTQESPPGINISFSKFKGQLSGEDPVCQIPNMKSFSDSEISSYTYTDKSNDLNHSDWHTLESGIHMYHLNENLTVNKIINYINPTPGNKIMIAYYPSANDKPDTKFYVYPSLEGQNTITDPANYIIPANEGFIIFSCKPGKIWKINNEKTTSIGLSSILTSTTSPKTNGWILISAPTLTFGQTLQTVLAAHGSNISSIWVQKGPYNGSSPAFPASAAFSNAVPDSTYRMLWLKFTPPTITPPPPTPGQALPTVNLSMQTPGGDLQSGKSTAMIALTFNSDKDVYLKKINLKITSTAPSLLSDIQEIGLYEGTVVQGSDNDFADGQAVLNFNSTDGSGYKISANTTKDFIISLKLKDPSTIGGKHKLDITDIEYGSAINKSSGYPAQISSEKTVIASTPAEPAAPISFANLPAVTNFTASSATVTFKEPSNLNSKTVSSYSLIYHSGTACNIPIGLKTITKNKEDITKNTDGSMTINLEGLNQNTKYFIKIAATVVNDKDYYSDCAELTTLLETVAQITFDNPPSVTGIAASSATVTFKEPSNLNSKTVSSYSVIYHTSTTCDGTSEIKKTIKQPSGYATNPDKTMYEKLTGLSENTTYFVKIAATVDELSYFSDCSTFKTTQSQAEAFPNTSTTFKPITTPDDNSSLIGWELPADEDATTITGYVIVYHTNGTCENTQNQKLQFVSNPNAKVEIIQNLTPKTKYFVYVGATKNSDLNNLGKYDFTNCTEFTTL